MYKTFSMEVGGRTLSVDIGRIGKQAGGMTSVMRAALDYMFLAHEEYLLEAYKAADELYGGIEGYIEKALGVDAAKRRMLQDRYLV